MSKFIIKVFYETGDSFHNEDTESTLDYDWESENVVIQNLKRIKEHYEMYEEMANNRHAPFKEINDKYGGRDWFVNKSKDAFLASHSLYLYTDDGRKFQYSCPWCGYFERLYGAEIIFERLDFSFQVI